MLVEVDELRKISLFASLAPDDMAYVAAVTVERRYERGDIIILEGDRGGALHFVRSGLVKVFKSSPEGREQVLRCSRRAARLTMFRRWMAGRIRRECGGAGTKHRLRDGWDRTSPPDRGAARCCPGDGAGAGGRIAPPRRAGRGFLVPPCDGAGGQDTARTGHQSGVRCGWLREVWPGGTPTDAAGDGGDGGHGARDGGPGAQRAGGDRGDSNAAWPDYRGESRTALLS